VSAGRMPPGRDSSAVVHQRDLGAGNERKSICIENETGKEAQRGRDPERNGETQVQRNPGAEKRHPPGRVYGVLPWQERDPENLVPGKTRGEKEKPRDPPRKCSAEREKTCKRDYRNPKENLFQCSIAAECTQAREADPQVSR